MRALQMSTHYLRMGSQRTDVEMQSSGAIGKASSRWSCGPLIVLTVHSFLIATCLAVVFYSIKKEESNQEVGSNTNDGILLLLENKHRIIKTPGNSTQGLLEFIPKDDVAHIKVHNKSVIEFGCRGPYILYPYIQNQNLNSVEPEAFNITVVSVQNGVLALIPFNTVDKSTWQGRILSLDNKESISVYVSCDGECPSVGHLCLALHFLLGNICY